MRRPCIEVVVGALCLVTVVPSLAPAARTAGGRIAWSRFTDKDFSAEQIVSARADGSDLRVLTRPAAGTLDIYPKWSPDGRRVLFERDLPDGSSHIVVVGAAGGRERVIDTGCVAPCASDIEPTWVPDGRIAFTRVTGPFNGPGGAATSAVLWTARDNGGDLRRLSQPGIGGVYEDYEPHWAPDGSYAVFNRVRNDPLGGAIFRMRPDGTGVRQLTPWELDADIPDLSPARAGPTKGLVVFETYAHGGAVQDIVTVPATCGSSTTCREQLHHVTHNPPDGATFSVSPAWSPTGTRITFAQWTVPASEAERKAQHWFPDIFTTNLAGNYRQRVSRSELWEWRPNWSSLQ